MQDILGNESDQLMGFKMNSSTTTDYISGNWYRVLQLLCLSGCIYIAIPFLFRLSPSIQRHMIFMHLLSFTRHKRNFYNPEVHGIEGGRNFYLSSPNEGPKIGIWHILPKSLAAISKGKPEEYWEDALKFSGRPVFLYFHGNGGTRATGHRLELYEFMQELDSHVIVFDYRGYADSSPIPPTETGVVGDGMTVYNWLVATMDGGKSAPIFFWGHSLGTGISSHLASKLQLEGKGANPLAGLILESPFSSMMDEVKSIYLTMIYRFWPCFEWCFAGSLPTNDFAFQSDIHIRHVEVPILILHVVNDIVVPYRLGRKLHDIASKFRSKTARPVSFKKLIGYSLPDAHVYICRDPKLPSIITEFTNSCVQNDWPSSY